MDDHEEMAGNVSPTPEDEAADGPSVDPIMEQLEVPLDLPPAAGDAAAQEPPVGARKPGLYLLRPRGLSPASRGLRRGRSRLRNDCPPDLRRPADRLSPKPRLR